MLGRHLAFRNRGLIVSADGGEPAVKSFLRDFFEQHRNPGIGIIHGDAAAHGACAHYRGGSDFERRRVLWNIRNLRDLAFREEQFHHGAGFGGEDTIREDFDLAARALIKTQPNAGFDGIYRSVGRVRPACRFLQPFACPGASCQSGSCLCNLQVQVSRFAYAIRGALLKREGHGSHEQVTLDDAVQDAFRRCSRRRHVLPKRTHFKRHGRTAQSRQTLGAARAWNNAEGNFRLAYPGCGRRHTIMTGHRKLEPAAKRRAMDGRHQGLRAIFDMAQPGVYGVRTLE